MPSSSEQPNHEHQAIDIGPYYQGDFLKPRLNDHKGPGKSRRKHEFGGENVSKDRASRVNPNELYVNG